MNKLMAMCQTWWRRAKSDCDPANGNAFAQGRGQGESTCAAELTAILSDVERLIEALREVLEYDKTQRRIPLGLYSKVQSAFALFGQPVAPKETR